MNKQCNNCNQVKSVDEFYRRANSKDGRDKKCKACREAISAEFDANNPDRVAARINTNSERIADHDRRYAKANPEKRRAKEKVKDALRAGRMTKQPCEKCGKTDVDAHHDDYSKPLSVRWLCRKHHREHHANLIAAGKCPDASHV